MRCYPGVGAAGGRGGGCGRVAINVVYCVDQDNDVALIARNYKKVGGLNQHGQGGFSATRSHIRYRRARRGSDRFWAELCY